MGDMSGADDPRGWAPLEPRPDPSPPTAPPPTAPPPSGPAGWAPPTGPPGWGPPQAPPPPTGAWGQPYGLPLPKGGDARTGPLPLHPMSVSDVLDGAFKLLKANAKTLVLVVSAVVVPVQLLSAYVVRAQVSPGLLNIMNDPTIAESQAEFTLGDAAGSFLTVILAAITAPLIAGLVSVVCAESYLGRSITAGEALRRTVRRLHWLLLASLLVFTLQGIGLMLCIVPGVILWVLYTAVTPALMIEHLGPIQAMRRSWRLLRPRFWGVLGISLLAWLITAFLGNLLGGIPTVIATLLGGSFAWLWIALGSVLSALVTAPITAIVDTLLYFDGRIRNEGFDLQVMAQDLHRTGAVG
jgi:hypothetical protein